MKKICTSFIALLLTFPALALAQSSDQYQFQRQGIFDCNQIGGLAQSVGAMSAIGGVYVPVNDAAVTLNTGILVYKECVLREVVDREREAAMTAFFKKMYTGIQQGRGGNPQYVVNYHNELLTGAADPAMLAVLKGSTLEALNPDLQSTVTRALARRYERDTRSPQTQFTCPYQGNLKDFQTGKSSFTFEGFLAGTDPRCDPVQVYYTAQAYANSRIAEAIANQQLDWQYGRGFYAVSDDAEDPLDRKIRTPASVVQSSFQQMLNSPVEQLQSANDIGQMIGALYAGLSTQVVTDTHGLSGLSTPNGGQPSYLDQVVSESANGVRNAAQNVALNILNAARTIEATYLQTVTAIGNEVGKAIAQLRSAENQCWGLIIQKVCAGSLRSDNTCDAVGGGTLKVATSTAFSDAAINGKIGSSESLQTDINNSKTAMQLIDNLIAGVTNTSSLDAQRVALQQLDALVARRSLHTQSDVAAKQQQLSQVQGGLATLVTDSVQSWADSTDPNVGWCNVNNQAVVDGWKQKWKR